MRLNVELPDDLGERLAAVAKANVWPAGVIASMMLRASLTGRPHGLILPWHKRGARREAQIEAAGKAYVAATAPAAE